MRAKCSVPSSVWLLSCGFSILRLISVRFASLSAVAIVTRLFIPKSVFAMFSTLSISFSRSIFAIACPPSSAIGLKFKFKNSMPAPPPLSSLSVSASFLAPSGLMLFPSRSSSLRLWLNLSSRESVDTPASSMLLYDRSRCVTCLLSCNASASANTCMYSTRLLKRSLLLPLSLIVLSTSPRALAAAMASSTGFTGSHKKSRHFSPYASSKLSMYLLR
mmetsp:Transcript_8580/g.14798  ORF Transcript_8580/g.14798 Transcript_8580/m.14798 type:complete len:218 (+) Transcript_8580:771-1424(+)